MGLSEGSDFIVYPIDENVGDDKTRQKVLISIQIPDYLLDKKADEFELESNLVHNFTPIFVKAKFKV